MLIGMYADIPANVVWDVVSRNWALFSILTTLVVLVVVPMAILGKYVRIMINILDDTPPPMCAGPRDFAPWTGEPMIFRALDGHRLHGTMYTADRGRRRRGAIIFAHEFASEGASCARYCAALYEAGYDVFSFDFRGHGESPHEEQYKPRQWPSDREESDVLGAIACVEDYLERRGLPVELGLFGISRGAGAAVLAAVEVPAVRAIAADGAFSSDATMEWLMKRFASIFAKIRLVAQNHPPTMWRFLRWLLFRECRRKFHCRFPSVRKALQRINVPLFFIHGQRDSYIPVEQSQMLYDVANEPKFLWLVPGAKHNQSVVAQPEQYARHVVAFFDRYLAGAEAGIDDFRPETFSGLTQPLAAPNAYSRLRAPTATSSR